MLSHKPSPAQLDVLLGQIQNLPLQPAVSTRLLDMLEGDSADALKQSASLIACDPALSARLLALAGSDSGLSVPLIAGRFGIDALRPAVLEASLAPWPAALASVLDLEQLGRHSLAVAIASELVARQLGDVDPEAAFLCGLMHDLGKLVLGCMLPKSYARAVELSRDSNLELAHHEREILGLDHCAAGRRLAQHWRLPAVIADAIFLHHQPLEAMPSSVAMPRLIAAVGLADTLVRRKGPLSGAGAMGDGGNSAFARPALQQARDLGLDEAALQHVTQELDAQFPQRLAVLGLDQPVEATDDTTRRSSLMLCRMNERLRRQSARLQVQSAAFELLRELSRSLGPDAQPADVLEQLASALSAVLNKVDRPAQPIVVYSVGEDECLAVIYQANSTARWRVMTLPAGVVASSTQPGAAREALGSLAAQFEAQGDMPDLSHYAHWPLVLSQPASNGFVPPSSGAVCRLGVPSTEHPQAASMRLEGGTSRMSCGGVAVCQSIGGIVANVGQGPESSAVREVLDALCGPLAWLLAIAQGRARAGAMSEQLAGASQVLAAAGQALADAQTVSAISAFASGAGHELNNPLAIISGKAQLMREHTTDDETAKAWDLMVEQAQRAADIIAELMQFASPRKPRPTAVSPRDLLQSAAADFSSSNHPKSRLSRVDIDIADGTPAAFVDAAQVRSVLAELIANAATAALKEPHITLSAKAAGRDLLLCVSDDGPGMDDATATAAFTPFFSLQRAGRRRGLGLPKARRHVEINGGKIWIRSAAREGTAVYVQLPAVLPQENDDDQSTSDGADR